MTEIYSDNEMKKEILDNAKVIAIVGLSENPMRASYRIGNYLKNQGYQIVPVNPKLSEFQGEKAYPDLKSIPFKVDLVDVFRRSEEVLDVIKEAQELGIPAVWLQLGIDCPEEGINLVKENDMKLVSNCCIMVEHKSLM
ncbi:MAG: CoA-binding protein [Syntrophomonadaceae bacterium]|nr:CoA-binding protein [Syntrophomonadaceae bacterium]